jgi:hypothetical protein
MHEENRCAVHGSALDDPGPLTRAKGEHPDGERVIVRGIPFRRRETPAENARQYQGALADRSMVQYGAARAPGGTAWPARWGGQAGTAPGRRLH